VRWTFVDRWEVLRLLLLALTLLADGRCAKDVPGRVGMELSREFAEGPGDAGEDCTSDTTHE
jgi:hypothetical protein